MKTELQMCLSHKKIAGTVCAIIIEFFSLFLSSLLFENFWEYVFFYSFIGVILFLLIFIIFNIRCSFLLENLFINLIITALILGQFGVDGLKFFHSDYITRFLIFIFNCKSDVLGVYLSSFIFVPLYFICTSSFFIIAYFFYKLLPKY